MCILCLWELTQRDSAAEVVLAVSFLLGMTVTLSWAALKVIRMAKRSVSMHKNPAYILYSDPAALNKWGFLYVQFRATAYYFVVPILFYTLIKAMFIGLAQNSPVAQAIALVLIEAALLIAVSYLRPWMDKKTNTFNISIAAINFLNGIFLLIFSNVFKQAVSSIEVNYSESYAHHVLEHCYRCGGSGTLRHQRRLRSYSFDPRSHLIFLCDFLQEPRYTISADEG